MSHPETETSQQLNEVNRVNHTQQNHPKQLSLSKMAKFGEAEGGLLP